MVCLSTINTSSNITFTSEINILSMLILTTLNPLFSNTLTMSTLLESSTIVVENLKLEQLKFVAESKKKVAANLVPNIVVIGNEMDNDNEGDWTKVGNNHNRKATSSVKKVTGRIVSAICD